MPDIPSIPPNPLANWGRPELNWWGLRFQQAMYLRTAGYSQEDALSFVRQVNDLEATGKLKAGEIVHIVGRAYVDKPVEIKNPERHPISWVWHRWIPERYITTLYGDEASLKSTIATGLALAVATGADFLGARTRQGPVLYGDAELDRERMEDRMVKISSQFGCLRHRRSLAVSMEGASIKA